MTRLSRTFGITDEQYEMILTQQQGRCGICGKKPLTRRLAVDHCHKIGFVRGLLCPTCNQAIGKFNDDTCLLVRAASYLRAAEDRFDALPSDQQVAWLLYRGRSNGKGRRARISKSSAPLPRLPQEGFYH